jgi:hypothetical protein
MEANRAYDDHISVLVVGIGDVDPYEIEAMSYEPQVEGRDYWIVQNVEDLPGILYRLQVMSCENAESKCRIGTLTLMQQSMNTDIY